MDNKTNKEFSSENLLKFYSNMNINNNVNQKKIHISKIKGIIFPLIIFNLLALVGLGNTEIISSISLKIHEKGYIQFIGYSKNDPRFPNEIKINNNLMTINDNKYNFTSLENNIIITPHIRFHRIYRHQAILHHLPHQVCGLYQKDFCLNCHKQHCNAIHFLCPSW